MTSEFEINDVEDVEELLRGRILIPLKIVARAVGLECQTIRNRMDKGTWPLKKVGEKKDRVFFHVVQVRPFLIKHFKNKPEVRLGTPTLRERRAAVAAGFLSVPDYRRAQAAANQKENGHE